jgi:hypothetical protein
MGEKKKKRRCRQAKRKQESIRFIKGNDYSKTSK